MALTWFAHIPFLASFTPSPVWNATTFRGLVTTTETANTCLIAECCSDPVDEDIFGQAGIWILDPAESIHHFSTVEFFNQLFQSSIWCINIVEKSSGYCGSLCNCWHFFPIANHGVRKQRQAVLLCWYSSTAMLTVAFLHTFANIVSRS